MNRNPRTLRKPKKKPDMFNIIFTCKQPSIKITSLRYEKFKYLGVILTEAGKFYTEN